MTRPFLLSAATLLVAAPLQAQSPILLQLGTSSSTDRMVVDSAGGLVVSGTYNVGTIPATGAGPRLMWYPKKAAFRSGFVNGTQWDDPNVGYVSSATGYETTASGYASAATGYSTEATASGSTAMGYNTRASGSYSTALGINTSADANAATVAGWGATASGDYSTAFGYETTASGIGSTALGHSTTASGLYSTAMGLSTTATGASSTAMGRLATATGDYAIAMGRYVTAGGNHSVAMGFRASTGSRSGAFVFGDASGVDTLRASANNEFSVRASGGYHLFTNSTMTSGVLLFPGAGSWNTVSDRARKEAFLGVDGEDILARVRALPVSTWRYLAEEDRSVRHIGPMAQDWHRAFGFSADSLTINSGDLDGVNLAGVQALEARTAGLRAENAALRAELGRVRDENAALRARQQETEARLRRIEQLLLASPRP